MSERATCTCGLIKVRKVGTHEVNGREVCNFCSLPLQASTAAVSTARVANAMVTTFDNVPGHVITKVFGIVTELTSAAGFTAASKGRDALEQAMPGLRAKAAALGATAVVGLRASTFGAGGGITNVLGGDAVGVLLIGTAVATEAVDRTLEPVQATRDN